MTTVYRTRPPRRPVGPADLTGWRVITAARVFALAIALGLTVTTGRLPDLAGAFTVLCLLGAMMSVPPPAPMLRVLAPVVEGALVGLVLTVVGEPAAVLLVYLLVPPFVAGVRLGAWGATATVGAEALAGVLTALGGEGTSALSPILELAAPWMLVGLGLGLLGSWVRASTRTVHTEKQRYESAHRLLAQLNSVARHLPHGLDAPSIAQRTLSYAVTDLDVTRAMLLLKDKSDTLVEVARQGPARFGEAPQDTALVNDAWQSGSCHQDVLEETETSDERCRAVLPLRVGARVVGVVVVDGPSPLTAREIRTVQGRLDEQSLRLESAMLFEQVRAMATVEERHRLAREIHDGIAQEIASLGYLVDELAASSDDEDTRSAARGLRGELTRVVNELRLSIFDLRTDVSNHGGLGQVLSDYARDMGARSGMTVHLALGECTRRLPVDVQTELLRIAQEAITNVRKHAQARNLWVTLNTNGRVALLRVEDDGVGAARTRDDHFGLRMMQERADRIGAELAITDRPRGGTSVVVALQPSPTTSPGAHRADFSAAR